jgi:photosystem II stability/assembly factor-like uncharacterized protein
MTLVKLGLAVALTIFGSAVAFADTSPFTKLPSLPGGGGTIAVDPTAPEKLYMSVGGGKIARSVDSGAHWSTVQVGTFNVQFGAIAVNPKHPNIVLASADGLYESENGGETWKLLPHQPAGEYGPAHFESGFIFNPAGTVIVAGDTLQGFFRSTDSGNTWTNLGLGSINAIVSDPNKPMTLWACGGASQTGNGVVWTSADFGQSWSEISIPILNAAESEVPVGIAIQPKSGDILITYLGFTMDPQNPFVGGVAVSKDGGKTWEKSSAGLSPNLVPRAPIFAPDDPTTVILPSPYFAYPDGLNRSTNAGKKWNAIGSASGLDGEVEITNVVAQPPGTRNPAQLLAAGSSFFSSANHGTVWKRQEVGLNAVGAVEVWGDGATDTGLYALGSTLRLYHSANGGKAWSHVDNWPGSAEVTGFAVDALAANHDAYAATYETSGSTVWQSSNLGSSWKKLGAPLPAGAYVSQIVVDPLKSGLVYLFYTTDTVGNGLLRSADGGQTWAKLSVGAKDDEFVFLNYGSISLLIAPDPGSSGTLYASMVSGFWKSTDHGTSWSNTGLLAKPALITGFAILPGNPEILFAGVSQRLQSTEAVVLNKSVDGGKTWAAVTNPFATENSSEYFSVLATPDGRLLAYANCGDNLVSKGNHIKLSTDHGKSWAPIDQPILPDLDSTACPYVSITSKNAYVTDPYGSQVTYTAPLDRL